MVERNLAKVDVVGSNPIIRSQNKKRYIVRCAVFVLQTLQMDSNPRRVGKLRASEQFGPEPQGHFHAGTLANATAP